jgi:hypothetical protein
MGWINTAIGAGAGFMIGGPAGAAVGAGIGSGVDTNQAIADRADSSNAWSASQYANRYQTTVKDLEAAGLNPMLAYSQGAGTAPTAQQVQFQNPVSAGFQAYQQYTGGQQSIATAGQAVHMNDQIDALTTKIEAETKNVTEQGIVLIQTAKMLDRQANLMDKQGLSQEVQTKVLGQTLHNLQQDGVLKGFDIDAIKKFDNFGREYKQYAPIVDLMKSILLPRSGGITINK